MENSLKKTIEELGTVVEEFKGTIDLRVTKLEKGEGIAELEAKLEKMNDHIDTVIALKENLEKIDASRNIRNDPDADALKEHKEAFQKFMRKGDESGFNGLTVKNVNIGTPGDGGYAVPEEIDRNVHDLLVDISPIREIANVVEVSTSDYKKLVNTRGTASGWVGETAARPETGTPTLVEVVPSMGEIYANPASTQQALDDMFFDVEAWLADEVATEFAEKEGNAFVLGDGVNKAKGFLDYTTAATADGSRAFGTLEHVATGVAGAFAAADPHEVLIDVVYALKQGHRNGARWVSNKSTLGAVRKMKDGDGNLIWQPGLIAGQPQTLMGYPITEAEDMPAIAANSLSLAFGNFMRGYLIVDRMGTRVLRDPFTNKPYVHFYTTKRVGGAVVDSQAIKFVKFSLA